MQSLVKLLNVRKKQKRDVSLNEKVNQRVSFYQLDALLALYMLWSSVSVCLSVCPSQARVVPNWLNTGSRKQRLAIAHDAVISTKFRWDYQLGAKCR